MRLDKFTVKAQEAVMRAQELARERDHSEITPLHLLASLLDEEQGVVGPLLEKLGADAARIRSNTEFASERLPRATGTQTGIARALQEVFDRAQKEADRLKD